MLGLYYITKSRPGAKGEAGILRPGGGDYRLQRRPCRPARQGKRNVDTVDEEGNPKRELIKETTIGRILFNQVVPKEVGYINTLLKKKNLRDIIGVIMKKAGADKAAVFLDDIKALGYQMAFKGGLSFNLDAVLIPKEKEQLVREGYEKVDEVYESYNMGFITNNERYNQVIDIWTRVNSELTETVSRQLEADMEGFNPVFMMLDSAPAVRATDTSALRYARSDGQAAEIRCGRRSGH